MNEDKNVTSVTQSLRTATDRRCESLPPGTLGPELVDVKETRSRGVYPDDIQVTSH